MKTLTVKIPEDMDAKLTSLATQQGQSKSEMVRIALEHIFMSNGQTNETSALDQIADLIGCVEGDKDLSYNKGHMKGYGR